MNVYEASNKKIDIIFNEFDNIYVSFSGGKDSGVLLNLCIDYIRKNKLNIKLGVFHLNYEADYSFTTEYIKRTFEKNKDILVVFNCCIPCKVETCTSMFQSYWRPWEGDKKELWINKIPEGAYTKKEFKFYNLKMWDYEFQNKFSLWHHQKHNAKRTCVLIGIRTQESLNRWRTIHSKKNMYKKYKGIKWIREIFNDVYNAYPIFDWKTQDVWIANYKFNWDYNKLYDMYYRAGVPIETQRIASPFLGAAKASLKLFKVIEPDTWSKLVSRVNGVNFTGIYGRTTAMGWRSITKPEHFTWENYMYFLLDTLPEKAKQSYLNKLETSMKFWNEKGGVLSNEVIQKLTEIGLKFEIVNNTNYKTNKKSVKMEYLDDINIKEFKLIPSYKRMCISIMKNDHQCKYLGFSPTKNELDKRQETIKKYKGLL